MRSEKLDYCSERLEFQDFPLPIPASHLTHPTSNQAAGYIHVN